MPLLFVHIVQILTTEEKERCNCILLMEKSDIYSIINYFAKKTLKELSLFSWTTGALYYCFSFLPEEFLHCTLPDSLGSCKLMEILVGRLFIFYINGFIYRITLEMSTFYESSAFIIFTSHQLTKLENLMERSFLLTIKLNS